MAENKNAKTPTDDGQPVAWLKTWSDGSLSVLKSKSRAFADHELEPLYAAPPKKQWVGLTGKDIDDCYFAARTPDFDLWDFAAEIDDLLREKNQ